MRGPARKHRCRVGAGAVLLSAIMALALALTAPAQAAPGDPLFIFSPKPPPPPASPKPPPTGYLNGPCGIAVDSAGRFWVSDYYHRAVDVFSPSVDFEGQPLASKSAFGSHSGPLDDPCGLALDSAATLYVNNFHRDVVRFPAPLSMATGTVLAGSEQATGVAVDPDDDDVYVNARD